MLIHVAFLYWIITVLVSSTTASIAGLSFLFLSVKKLGQFCTMFQNFFADFANRTRCYLVVFRVLLKHAVRACLQGFCDWLVFSI